MPVNISMNGDEMSVEGDSDSVDGSINVAGRDMVINNRRVKKVVKEVLLECTHCGTTRKKNKDGEVKCESCGASSFRRADIK